MPQRRHRALPQPDGRGVSGTALVARRQTARRCSRWAASTSASAGSGMRPPLALTRGDRRDPHRRALLGSSPDRRRARGVGAGGEPPMPAVADAPDRVPGCGQRHAPTAKGEARRSSTGTDRLRRGWHGHRQLRIWPRGPNSLSQHLYHDTVRSHLAALSALGTAKPLDGCTSVSATPQPIRTRRAPPFAGGKDMGR